ncbi:MAG: hypothetical protein WCF57_14760 [Pyrinomonadaceae bacterium]
MMKRTRITVETERVLLVSSRRRVIESWCDACGRAVKLIRAEDAAFISGVGLREICRRVESNNLHYTETAERALLICLDSLLK